MSDQKELKKIPGVDTLLDEVDFPSSFPSKIQTSIIRDHLSDVRDSVQNGSNCPEEEVLVQDIQKRILEFQANRIQSVINATGVIIHTNLGRAPYSRSTIESISEALDGYCSLEVDLKTGNRGRRGFYAEKLLCELSGAQSAGIVNNCSAGLLLALRTLSNGKDVLISRGELIQIGGGFRIPEILESSGANLREVGTTNRTSLDDYKNALDEDVALILSVHRSNFDMVGFTNSPDLNELARLAGEAGIPLLSDLGSGALWDTSRADMKREPTPEYHIEQGADLVMFSGDKLLGGPQAGLFTGRRDYVENMKNDPFFRALRCDKTTLIALESTLEQLMNEDEQSLPVPRLLMMDEDQIQKRAESICAKLDSDRITTIPLEARVGGGSLPRERLPSYGLAIETSDPEELSEDLRTMDPPLVGVIQEDRVCINLRTVFEDQDDLIIDNLSKLNVS